MGISERPIVLNARTAVRTTLRGVERWSREVIPRLRELRPERYVVVAPAEHPQTGRPSQRERRSRLAEQGWEQLVLPARAARLRAGVVLSPANLAPLAWPHNVVVIHDAAVFRERDAYWSLYGTWHRLVETLAARRALKVITVSEFSRRELIAQIGLDADRVVVIGGGVDDRFRAELDHEPVTGRLGLHAPYVLTVCSADRKKNLRALDPVASRLKKLGIELVWAGSPRRNLLADQPGPGVRALGYVPDDELPALYRGALAFVLPSRYEGFGLPCLEAMASGTPVVAAERGALPETCGGAALLVDPDDPEQLGEAVIRAATDQQVRAQLIDEGLRRAAACSWDQAARRVDEVLVGVAREAG